MTPNLHLLGRKRRYILNDIATTNAAQAVDDWRVRCLYLGATTLSTLTLRAVTDLVNGLMSDGIWPKVFMMMPYPPDGLGAAMTPLVQYPGLTVAGQVFPNGGVTGGQLSINGLALTAGQYIQTNWQPTTWGSAGLPGGINYMSIIHYNSVVTASGLVCGSYQTPSDDGFQCGAQYTDGNAHSQLGSILNNAITVTPSPGAGYYCHSRVSNTDHRFYFANSTNSHAQIGVTDTVAGPAGLAAQQSALHAICTNNSFSNTTTDRISFLAFCGGMSQNDSANFFNRVQAYRVAIGGGYV